MVNVTYTLRMAEWWLFAGIWTIWSEISTGICRRPLALGMKTDWEERGGGMQAPRLSHTANLTVDSKRHKTSNLVWPSRLLWRNTCQNRRLEQILFNNLLFWFKYFKYFNICHLVLPNPAVCLMFLFSFLFIDSPLFIIFFFPFFALCSTTITPKAITFLSLLSCCNTLISSSLSWKQFVIDLHFTWPGLQHQVSYFIQYVNLRFRQNHPFYQFLPGFWLDETPFVPPLFVPCTKYVKLLIVRMWS